MNEMTELLRHRILFLYENVTDHAANRLVAQLLLLDAEDQQRPIDLYINCRGGSVSDGLAIIDTMRCIVAPVSTICVGQASSMGAVLLAAGRKGMRKATPTAEVMIHQVRGAVEGVTSDVQIRAEHMARRQEELVNLLASWTGQTADTIRTDLERDCYLTAQQALDYGIIDEILVPHNAADSSS